MAKKKKDFSGGFAYAQFLALFCESLRGSINFTYICYCDYCQLKNKNINILYGMDDEIS